MTPAWTLFLNLPAVTIKIHFHLTPSLHLDPFPIPPPNTSQEGSKQRRSVGGATGAVALGAKFQKKKKSINNKVVIDF